MKKISTILRVGTTISAISLALILGRAAQAQSVLIWTGGQYDQVGLTNINSGDLNWSDPNNWTNTTLGGTSSPNGDADFDSIIFTNPSLTGLSLQTTNDQSGALIGNVTTVGSNPGAGIGIWGQSMALSGNLTANAGTLSIGNSVFLDQGGGNSIWTVNAPVFIQSLGNITDSSGYGFTGGLTKNGPSLMRLNGGSLSFSGNLVINAGTIDCNGSYMIQIGGDVIVNSGGQLNLDNCFTSVNGLDGSGTVSKNGSGGRILYMGVNGDGGTFSGTIVRNSGTFSLIKQGAGTETLSGNIYMGGSLSAAAGYGTISVQGGALLINGVETQGGTISVNSSGILGGNGNIGLGVGALKVASGGTLTPSPDTVNPGLLTLGGSLTMAAGGNYDVILNGQGSPGSVYSSLKVGAPATGSSLITLGNANLVISLGYTPALGDSFDIIQNNTASAVSGLLDVGGTPQAEDSTFVVGGTEFAISYIGMNYDTSVQQYGANDVVLSVIPEPSSLLLVGVGLMGACLLRRRIHS